MAAAAEPMRRHLPDMWGELGVDVLNVQPPGSGLQRPAVGGLPGVPGRGGDPRRPSLVEYATNKTVSEF
ncbi:hypothetical protein GCM10022403_088630 [Streptomyces coacervatus]|uniref:Uncharacterized protein n=1 Tax=Streptomyces coacervatus TaxID=647381 RepID=A0ABP7JEI2_9ACTN